MLLLNIVEVHLCSSEWEEKMLRVSLMLHLRKDYQTLVKELPV
jgi:hypothetical protein